MKPRRSEITLGADSLVRMHFRVYKFGVTQRLTQDFRMRLAIREIVDLRSEVTDLREINGNLQHQNTEQKAALDILHASLEKHNTRANKAERKLRRKEPYATIGKIAIGVTVLGLGKSAVDYFGLKL